MTSGNAHWGSGCPTSNWGGHESASYQCVQRDVFVCMYFCTFVCTVHNTVYMYAQTWKLPVCKDCCIVFSLPLSNVITCLHVAWFWFPAQTTVHLAGHG